MIVGPKQFGGKTMKAPPRVLGTVGRVLGGEDSTPSGSRALLLIAALLGAAVAGVTTPACAQDIGCGETIAADIAAGVTEGYFFTAAQSEVISVTVGKTGGGIGFSPRSDLFCGGVRQILTGDTDDSGMTCAGSCQALLSSTNCKVEVFDLGLGAAGSYNVTLEAVSGSFNGASNAPETPACMRGGAGTQPIHCGETLTRAIDGIGETDTFTFLAAAGDVVSITVVNAGGEVAFTPGWELFSPTGEALTLVGFDTLGTGTRCAGQCEPEQPLEAGVYTI